LLANAQETVGNVVSKLRALPSRAIGYILKFQEKMDWMTDKMDEYIGYAETFLELTSTSEGLTGVVKNLLSESLTVLESKLGNLLTKCVAAGLGRSLLVCVDAC